MADQPTNGNVLAYKVEQLQGDVERIEETVTDHGQKIVSLSKDSDTHKETTERIEKKLDSTNNWLRGIAGSLVLALILMVIGLMTHQKVGAP
jgi:peptidoglycan hydrolase CwlO-like protein